EEDEEHRREVEADGEALLRRRSRRHTGLERDDACTGAPAGPRREREAAVEHREGDDQREEPVDRERQPVVEQGAPSGQRRGEPSTFVCPCTKGTETHSAKRVAGVTKSRRRRS